MEHLSEVKSAVNIPVLRKDFVTDPYQVFEARAYGADALLLIIAVLDGPRLRELLREAAGLWLQCLVEVHNRAEMRRRWTPGPRSSASTIGTFHTFHTDLRVTEELAPLAARGKILVSESGISARQDLVRLGRRASTPCWWGGPGHGAGPWGEGAGAPGTARARPCRRGRTGRTRRAVTVVKVCGVRELAPMLAAAEAGPTWWASTSFRGAPPG